MNKLVNKFCNLLMKSGNKARAYALFSESFTLFLKNTYYKEILDQPKADKIPLRDFTPWREDPSKTTQRYSMERETDRESQNPLYLPSGQDDLLPYDSNKYLFNNTFATESTKIRNRVEEEVNKKTPAYFDNNTRESKIPCENILTNIIENVRPCIEIRKVRVARATYQVPAQISRLKGETLALRWIIESANKKKEKDKISLPQALALELANAHKKQGGPRQRRSELHKTAEANRSNVRYRWW